MARKRVFVSYTHADRDAVEPIIERMRAVAAFDIFVDCERLLACEPLSPRVREALEGADCIVPFLSVRFIRRAWPMRELHHALYRQLSAQKQLLFPCAIGKITDDAISGLFRVSDARPMYTRIPFPNAAGYCDAIDRFFEVIQRGAVGLPEHQIDYAVLKIPVPGLEIYRTDAERKWGKHEDLRYVEMIDSYLLYGQSRQGGEQSRHFVVCTLRSMQQTMSQLRAHVRHLRVDPTHGNEQWVWFPVSEYP